MKKIIATFLFGLFSYCIFADDYKEYILTFSKKDFTFTLDKNAYVINCKNDSMFYCDNTRMPAVPCKPVSFLLPFGQDYAGYEVSYESDSKFSSVKLYNNSAPLTTDNNMVNSDKTIATSSISSPIINMSTHVYCGYQYTSFIITPFLYDAKKSNLSFLKTIKIKIKTKNKSKINFSYNKETNKDICGLVLNKEIADSYIPTINALNLDDDLGEPLAYMKKLIYKKPTTEYVIITSSDLAPSFKPLARWKNRRNIATEIVTTDSIYKTYSGDTHQLQIKTFLKEKYDEGLRYVLFGGDAEIVPSQTYIYHMGKDYETFSNVPCDLYYACFDKCFDWDTNKNGLYGEAKDSVDIVPEIFYSRLPVKNSSDVENVIKKIIDYESNPPLDDYLNKMLYCGWKLSSSTSTHATHEELYKNYVSSRWGGEFYYIDDESCNLPSGETEHILPEDNMDTAEEYLRSAIDEKFFLIHNSCHGSDKAWGTGEKIFYDTSTAERQENYPASIILTTACLTNAFGIDTQCLSESFILNPYGGALAYLGSSHVGWFDIGKTITNDRSIGFNVRILDRLLSSDYDDRHWAKAVALGKADLACYSDNSSDYTLQIFLNPMGDAEMPIYKSDVKKLNNAYVTMLDEHLLDICPGDTGCTVAVATDIEGDSVCIFKNKGHVYVDNVMGAYHVTITKPNYIPYSVDYVPTISKEKRKDSDKYSIDIKQNQLVFNLNDSFIATDTWNITLIDALKGNVIKNISGGKGENLVLDITNIPSNIYIANIKTANKTYSKKISL